jgi:hypothetical protein
MLWRLAFPLTMPAMVTVAVYTGVTAWNGFLLPLILTQSPTRRTMPLALWSFQTQFTVNVPAVLAVRRTQHPPHGGALHDRTPPPGQRTERGLQQVTLGGCQARLYCSTMAGSGPAASR